MGFRIGRLQLGAPSIAVVEPMGDPIAGVGGAPVPAPRVPQQLQVQLNTIVTGATSVAQGQILRRQLRSLLNNSQLKYQGYLYVVYDEDPEINGWYVPDASTMSGVDSTSWVAGLWQTDAMNLSLVGHQRTHREGRQIWMKDLTTGNYQRDTIGAIYSTDFATYKTNWANAGQPAPQLVAVPPGASGVAQTVQNQAYAQAPLPAGWDGSFSTQLTSVPDLAAVVFDRAESQLNKADVVVYDRRGILTAPTTGPAAGWEEVYGPDYPWNWLTVGQPVDCPVLDNGLVRVRFDSTNTPGFRIDVWTGTAYVEQGKLMFRRVGDSTVFDDTWVSASLREYTPDRAVVNVVMKASADAISRENIFITLQRGQFNVQFECYPSNKAAGTLSDMIFAWSIPPADLNDSLMQSDSRISPALAGTGKIMATAGTGSASFSSTATNVGNADFTTSENFGSLLRCITGIDTPGPYQLNMAVLQLALTFQNGGSTYVTAGYGSSTNTVLMKSTTATGYVQVQLSFSPTTSDQANEAESFRNTGSGTTSQQADATASNALAVRDTQAAATAATLTKTSNLLQAKYRIFVRARALAGTASVRAALGGTTSNTTTTTSTTYVWLDLGDVLAPSANPTFTVTAWATATGVQVDRVEAFLMEDRARGNNIYVGARDQAQAALYDARVLGVLTSR